MSSQQNNFYVYQFNKRFRDRRHLKEFRIGESQGNLSHDLRRGRQQSTWIALWALWMPTLPRNKYSKVQRLTTSADIVFCFLFHTMMCVSHHNQCFTHTCFTPYLCIHTKGACFTLHLMLGSHQNSTGNTQNLKVHTIHWTVSHQKQVYSHRKRTIHTTWYKNSH